MRRLSREADSPRYETVCRNLEVKRLSNKKGEKWLARYENCGGSGRPRRQINCDKRITNCRRLRSDKSVEAKTSGRTAEWFQVGHYLPICIRTRHCKDTTVSPNARPEVQAAQPRRWLPTKHPRMLDAATRPSHTATLDRQRTAVVWGMYPSCCISINHALRMQRPASTVTER